MRAEHLFTIGPDSPFLAVLADKVLDGTLLNGWPREGPFWLSDVTIVLPTRRARLALAETFAQRLGGTALLPDIRTFGGENAEEEPFLPPVEAPPLPSAMPLRRRQLALAALVDGWARTPDGQAVLATPPNPAEILALSASLGELVDELAIEGVPYGKLRALPPENLAVNWQETLRFLDIAFRYWPERLAELGLEDAAEVRNQRLRRQAETAPLIYGERPVIAAGSTGSVPATADLLRAIVRLPRGALVLPGLDTTLKADEHDKLLSADANLHGHPQYGLVKLLRRLGAGPGAFVELSPKEHPRTAVVRAALARPGASAWWIEMRTQVDLAAATAGLTTIAAHTADEEARAIALCAHAALVGSKTVGIVSPDQNLARRIAAELKRFDVLVDDPAGTPLYQSPAGRLARLLLEVAVSRFGPVELVALLRHPGATFGMERREVSRLTDRIELCLLRGQRLRPGIEGLRHALAANSEAKRGPRFTEAEQEQVASLFDHLQRAIAPLGALLNAPTTAKAMAGALAISFAATVAGGEVAGAAELVAWEAELTANDEAGPHFSPHGLDGVLRVLMDGATVRNREQRRDDIFIWGQLEARLQNPDLMILAGLNEDVWPRAADPGPWLSRGMRLALGLEPPERRHGQAAHDFEVAIGNAQAVIAFSERIGTSPALPSRLVQRLEAFLGDGLSKEMRARGRRWIDQARAIDAPGGAARPAPRPVPRPTVEARPKKLSITEIETLFRSPYDIYARHVLGLRKLAPLGEEPDAKERGIMVHEVFARFVQDGLDIHAPDAFDRLREFAVNAFAGLDAIEDRRAIWLRRFETAARQFIAHERARDADVARRRAEIDGKWVLPSGFELTGRADRIDILRDGTAEIIDFKTGSVPSTGDMTEFLAPQLPLEAAMLEAGAFEAMEPTGTSAMGFIKIGLGPSAFVPIHFRARGSYMEAAAEASQRLNALVDALLLRDTPMTSQVLPATGRRYRGDYDHLARVDEWAINEGDDSE